MTNRIARRGDVIEFAGTSGIELLTVTSVKVYRGYYDGKAIRRYNVTSADGSKFNVALDDRFTVI